MSDDTNDLYLHYDEAHPDEQHSSVEEDKDRLLSETDASVGAEELEMMRQDDTVIADDDRQESPFDAEVAAGRATQDELDRLTGELDRHQRALAEALNSRRRLEERTRLDVQRANEDFFQQLLPVVDGLQRAQEAAQQENASLDSMREGLALIERQMRSFLAGVSVEIIEAKVGDPFDETVHEAMMRQQAAGVPEGHISAVFDRGFRLGERVVRPARVAVAAPTLDTEA